MLKPIKGYEKLYSATEQGLIYSHKSKRFLKLIQEKNGYNTVTLYKNNKGKKTLVHRIIAKTFIDNPLIKPMVNHKDLNKQNNCVSNLEWVTAQENIIHATNNGIRCGENNGNSKLTKNDILDIRSKYKFREYTQEMLSKEYGVQKTYISRIIRRIVWKQI